MSYEIDLPLPDENDYAGASLRSARENNRIYAEVIEQQDPFCTYMAGVRWLILNLSREHFAEAASVDETAVRGIETSGSMPTISTLHRVYRYFDDIDAHYRQHSLPERFLDVTVRERYGSSRRMHAPDPVHAPEAGEAAPLSAIQVYYRWAIMKTMEKVEEAAGISVGGLWQREATGVLPDFAEMSGAHKKLKLPPQEIALARESWSHDRMNQLDWRTLPPVLGAFLTRLEAECGLPCFTAAAIRTALGCTYEQAQRLQAGLMVPLDAVLPAARRLYTGDALADFAEQWEDAHALEKMQPRFGAEFMRIRDQIGVTNRQLSIAMDIRAPENREGAPKKKKSTRQEPFRPSHMIRESLENPQNSAIAPAGVLVGLVAGAATDAGEDDPSEHLRSVFTENRGTALRRSGASMHSSPVRLGRDYWGLSREEVAAELRLTPDELAHIEAQGDDFPAAALKAVDKLGQARLDIALQRWNELIRPPEPVSVKDLFLSLQRKAGSNQALETLITRSAFESKRGISGPGLAAIIDGSVVPTWALMQRITAQSGLMEFPDADAKPEKGEALTTHDRLWQDWCVRYADALQERGVTEPLARSLHHLYAQHAESLRDFIPLMNITYPTQTRIMQRLERGEDVDWAHVARTLDAAGLSAKSPHYRFVAGLHAGTIGDALENARAGSRKEETFLRESYAFGLTAAERKKHKLGLPESYAEKK